MSSNIKAKRPLLQPNHFIEGSTTLRNNGLCFVRKICKDDRELEVYDMKRRDVDGFLATIATVRPYTLVVLNPIDLPPTALLEYLTMGTENSILDNGITIDYGLPERYDMHWKRDINAEYDFEEQYLVLVAFASNNVEPVGYLGFKPVISRDRSEPRQLFMLVELNLVYVIPSHRGQGYGMDLSIACSIVCQDILTALYRAVPPNTVVHPSVYADYESCGGKDCATQIKSSLDYCVEMLRESGKRRSVQLDNVELDAGF